MKKSTLLLAISIVLTITTFAQKKKNQQPPVEIPTFNMTSNSTVEYSEVVEVTGSAADLYKKALDWFNTYYKNPSSVIREKKEGESIKGKGKFRIYDVNQETGSKTPSNGMMMYDITISLKDGKYRYVIEKITQKSSSFVGIEKWINENTDAQRFLTANYLVQVDKELKNVASKLKAHMAANNSSKSSDW